MAESPSTDGGDDLTPVQRSRNSSFRSRQPSVLRRARTVGMTAMAVAHVPKRLRRHPPPTPALDLEWVTLVEDAGSGEKEPTYGDLRNMDKRRKNLLKLARSTTASETIFRLLQLPRTVLPRLAKKPLIYIFLVAFTGGAVLTRTGIMGASDIEEAGLLTDTGGNMVTFIVVFYVGYCYNRSNAQFDDVQLIMHSINDACLSARVSFADSEEVHRLWRYLNLLHASAYCGLTEELSESNFFMPIVEKYRLLGEDATIKEEELEVLSKINLDKNGSRACSMFEVWSAEIVKGEARRQRADGGIGDLTPPIQASILQQIMIVGTCIKRLFAYRYQVMPFIYTHLVSLSCFVYLITESFLSGIAFVPGSSITFGLVVPLVLVMTKIISTFGLIEVGETILDPFGNDPEDFAIMHFVEVTAVSSHEAIGVVSCGARRKDREDFYDEKELAAAKALIRKIVERFRWRKIKAAAKAEAEYKRMMAVRKAQALGSPDAGTLASLRADHGAAAATGLAVEVKFAASASRPANARPPFFARSAAAAAAGDGSVSQPVERKRQKGKKKHHHLNGGGAGASTNGGATSNGTVVEHPGRAFGDAAVPAEEATASFMARAPKSVTISTTDDTFSA